MEQLKFYCFIILACLVIQSCNNASESVVETSNIDSFPGPPSLDTVTAELPPTDSTGNNNQEEILPTANIAYSYKDKMQKGDKERIQVNAQLNVPPETVEANLRNSLGEEKARLTGSSDTSIVKSLSIANDKYFLVSISRYDTAVFKIDTIFGAEKQELKFSKPSKWIWEVTAKKETANSRIDIVVKTEDANGKINDRDITTLQIEITVGAILGNVLTPVKKQSFFTRYSWLFLFLAVIIIILLIGAGWRKKRRLKEINSRIYFSYAWTDEKGSLVDRLYNSLHQQGYHVIRDKVDLQYKGLISGFMSDIGKGNIIIIALSDKYLKSRFCMFELYEIYRNCGMSKADFVKKVFPVRVEEINLSDPHVIDQYADYWKAEELKHEAIVKDVNQETTSEQFAQYEAVKRIASEIGNLLNFLSDINSLNIELISENDFAAMKQSLDEAIKNLNAAM